LTVGNYTFTFVPSEFFLEAYVCRATYSSGNVTVSAPRFVFALVKNHARQGHYVNGRASCWPVKSFRFGFVGCQPFPCGQLSYVCNLRCFFALDFYYGLVALPL
jgi:hypothetical protein